MISAPSKGGVGKGAEVGVIPDPHPHPCTRGAGGGGGAPEASGKVGVSEPAQRPKITAESLGIVPQEAQRLLPVAWTDPEAGNEPAQAWRWNEQRRTSFMSCRVSDIEDRWIRAAAAALNLSMSDYTRHALMFYAGQTLRKVEAGGDE